MIWVISFYTFFQVGSSLGQSWETQLDLKNGVLWDVMLCGSCKNRRFGGT
jgi:hypothetical protein